jgi:hypothetical protein
MEAVGSLYEEKVFVPKDTFKTQTEKKVIAAKPNPKAFVSKPSGPEEADGVQTEILDPKTTKDNNFYEPKKFSQNCEKTETETINNFMNKSIFDKLYEDVMSDREDGVESSDLDALGLPGEEPAAEEGGDTVTVTLDKELAQKLHDVLMGVLEGEVEDELEGESDSEDAESCADDNDEDENTLGEATHLEELPKSKGESLQSKNNKVGDVTASLTSKGDGEGAVTDECGTKDTGKHALVQDLDTGNLKGKNNKVASKTSKVGAYLAGLK